MVLHPLSAICAMLAALPSAVGAQPVMSDSQLNHIVSFRRMAAQGMSLHLPSSFRQDISLISNRFDARSDMFEPYLGTTMMLYQRSSNRIVLFVLHEDPRRFEASPVPIGEDQFRILAERYAVAAGFDMPMTLGSIEDGEEEQYPTKHLKFTIRYRNVKVQCLDCEFDIDVRTGALLEMSLPWLPLPLPPSSVIPAYSPSEAIDLCYNWIVDRFGPVYLESTRCNLFIDSPPLYRPDAYTIINDSPDIRRARESNQGMLVYGCGFRVPGTKRYYHVILDAQSGDYLEVAKSPGGYGSEGKSSPFAWDVGPCPINIQVGKPTSVCDVAQVSLESAPVKGFQGVPVILNLARLHIPAQYDAKLRLLRAGNAYGRPNPALINALDRALHITIKPSRLGAIDR